MGLSGFDFAALEELAPDLAGIDAATKAQLEKEMVYHAYLQRQDSQIRAMKADENRRFPQGFEFGSVSGLSNELVGKLSRAQPETLAHAARIEGMTPAALVLLLSRIQQHEKRISA